MEETTILQYLTSPNPKLDCSRSLRGTNTLNAKWDTVTDIAEWTDFKFSNLILMFGQILQQPIPPVPATHPVLSSLDMQIFTERTFETILERTIIPEVSMALRVAWPLCYPHDGPESIAELAKGDKARRGTTEEDDRYYPDWAGIRQDELTDFGYKNLCPGETKLASKWSTSSKGRRQPDYLYPFNQIQTYCGRQWGSRYGYIVTPEELVVVQITKNSVGPGLSASRSMRGPPPAVRQVSHSRTFSTETVHSEFQAMSLETASAFTDDANPDIEYGPLYFRSIPWQAQGKGVLTIRSALWWLHMMTRYDISIQEKYSPLGKLSSREEMSIDAEAIRVLLPPESAQDKKTTKDQSQSAGTGKKKK